MKKTIFWDFNGTILDDAYLVYEILVDMLEEVNQPTVTFEQYLNIFTFPVRDYYAQVYDLEKTPFDGLAKRFIELYMTRSLNAKLHDHVVETIQYFKAKGYRNVVLSASEKNNLLKQLKYYHIDHLFDAVLGTDNVHANGKIGIGNAYIKDHHIDTQHAVMVGDTIHDAEVAESLGVSFVCFTKGHQHPSRLKQYQTIDDFRNLKHLIET